MAPYFTMLASKADYASLVRPQSGKVILVAFWPGDKTSTALTSALKKLLPKSDFPVLAAELEITIVPTLMWFMDGVMDPMVWHQGVCVEGESVEKGVNRVVQRLKGSNEVGLDEDSDDDW
jgi:hypothetical protein